MIDKIVSSPSLILKKVTAQKIFGLNLTLHTREACGVAKKQWASIAEAHCLENKIPLNLLMVPKAGVEPERPEGTIFTSRCILPDASL